MKPMNLFFVISILFLNGCWKEKEDDGGKYYELNYSDEVSSILISDSIHIVIMQYGPITLIKDSIPYSVENNIQKGDTILIRMDVKFGSPSQYPTPNKQVTISKDTLLLWYASSPSPTYSLQKTYTLMQVDAEPKAIYYSIQSVVIVKSPNKYVSFHSKNMSM